MTIDLKAYFARIGHDRNTTPATLETLQALHLRHSESIPFENLNPFLKWPVLLDPASLQKKLIDARRGGYCYEQNLLFKTALEALGFSVTGLAARVVWNVPDDVTLPRTHMLLRVDLAARSYIADVGFGGLTLTAPLVLEVQTEQHTPHGHFRLMPYGDELMLEAKLSDEWKQLYRFTLEPQSLSDYEMANWYVSTHPKSRFVNGLVAARPARDRRYAVANNEFTVRHIDGKIERRLLATAAELRKILEGPLGVSVPETPELDAALERLVSS